ncbi:MAG: DUF262 domain-containing protein [Microcoleus sp. PH2017_40_RAT_O_B]|uniref:DUF262 domain-containing protein n=1 Tax=unclassified Microcoleus TaxID=2642155 RepID=UPI001D77A3A2|nr:MULTISPECIES: DUF262 domain-containing protein [unclassified Microcoleus]MCC3572682.1 DUF262 domain-containing protein [Microcoleus sp. PH2017_34_RAT_O_A]MCC3610279.1 DUF262 domain-containing protein [Microcoleus sp. PH2017_40_RAT_O_B]
MRSKLEITEQHKKVDAAEAEIRDKQQLVNYDTKEYPVEILVQKYMEGKDDDTNELFIPDYQREMAWDEARQSKFIESIILGLPIPYIFVADIREDENDEARLEIIDGTQRIRTLSRFINNELTLTDLQKIQSLNGFKFADLPLARQRRFNRTTLRMIQLTESANEEARRDIFERINTGSVDLNEMEKRRGILPGQFLELIEELSKHDKFRKLCAFSESAIRSREPQEFVLRFFAFLNNYQQFNSKINIFLDEYLKRVNADPKFDREKMRAEFESMLNFVEKYFPQGFRQGKNGARTTTRIKFESLAVGVALALRQSRNLEPKSTEFLNSKEFKDYTKSDASSSKNKVVLRIEYVRDRLLG